MRNSIINNLFIQKYDIISQYFINGKIDL